MIKLTEKQWKAIEKLTGLKYYKTHNMFASTGRYEERSYLLIRYGIVYGQFDGEVIKSLGDFEFSDYPSVTVAPFPIVWLKPLGNILEGE